MMEQRFWYDENGHKHDRQAEDPELVAAELEIPLITPDMIDRMSPADLAAAHRDQDAAYRRLNRQFPR